jgi:formate/nitrite transporter
MSYVAPDALIAALAHSGAAKARLPLGRLVVRGAMAGAILGCATTFAYTATAQTGVPLVGALLFPVGFVLVVLLGLELVTGSFALIPLAILEREASIPMALRNFGVVLLAHLGGALLYGAVFAAVVTSFGTNSSEPVVGAITAAAEHKTLAYEALGVQGLALVFLKAMLCNWMIALGTVMSYSSTATSGKILAMWLPVTAFFTLGFEHNVVNMFVIPTGMMLGAPISIGEWLVWNQIPAILGNLAGSVLLTALPLWLAHRKAAGSTLVPLETADSR